MELSTVEFQDFLALADRLWRKGANSVANKMKDSGFVEEFNMPANSGDSRIFTEIDTNEYISSKKENAQAARAKIQQGYTKVMTFTRFAENVSISYEMRTRNKYPEVVRSLISAGSKCMKTMDLDLSHRLTFGTATSYTNRDGDTVDTSCGDTLALFSTAHTLKGSSTTYRNILANNPKVSKGAIEAMERMIIDNTYSQLGEKKTLSYDILWSTDDPNSVNTIREYLLSTAAVDGANAGVKNVLQGKYTHVILPRVATDANGNNDSTKRYYWGLGSSEQKPIILGVIEAPHMTSAAPGNNGEDIQTDAWEMGVRCGYGICSPSGLGLTLSKGDASA